MNSFGKFFRVSIFGESHGPAIGVTLDGVPENISLCEEDFAEDIARRAPGAKGTTPRLEADKPKILSGVFNGVTTGAPLTIIFWNSNVQSEDYLRFDATPRPGHADLVANIRYNFCNDPRGGGHFSGRLTLPIVAAGVVAKKIIHSRIEQERLDRKDGEEIPPISINARLIEIGGEEDKSKWEDLLEQTAKEGNSLGGIIECLIEGLPIGYGEPFWDSFESLMAHAMFSIPGIRGIEFGDGFYSARMKGSEHNDPWGPKGPIGRHAGGINGGMTNSGPVIFRVAVKPTSSIALPQKTWNFEKGRYSTLEIKGRHDVCFALRTPVIVEAMAAIVLVDLM